MELNASDEQLDFPVVYTSAKDGIAKYEIDDESDNLIPLFETIIKRVKDTEGNVDEPFQFLISAIPAICKCFILWRDVFFLATCYYN